MARWSGTRLCRLDDLAEGAPRGFELGDDTDRLDVVVLRQGERIIAYRNECPHAGSPLDLMPDQFLSADGRHLQCHTHGALFRIEDGMCIAGPCLGRALAPVALRIEDGALLIA
jgi:nitrite reductase/ring-hydroxylating ferredoxin subunit